MATNNGIRVRQPEGFAWLPDEPTYDPSVHLQLEEPEQRWDLEAFGYAPEDRAEQPFSLAITTPFRLLSEEGVRAARNVVEQLKKHHRASDRIAKFVRGGVLHSRFLRDLCNCPHITEHVTKLAGASVLPHTMPLYQGHINLIPDEPARDVDHWHTDTVRLDYVLMLTDPGSFDGGYFEYFKAPKESAAAALLQHDTSSLEKVSIRFPEAGFAVLQQGNLVMHRAMGVSKGLERTTLVNSYVAEDPHVHDVSRLDDCKPVDPPELLLTEWARHKAFRTQQKLQKLIDTLPHTDDRDAICAALRDAILDVQTAIVEISDPSPGRLVHFGGDALTDPQV